MSKNKTNDKKKLSGAEGFEEYYGNLFAQRWQGLKAALFQEPKYAEWNTGKKSYFLDAGSVRAALSLPLEGAEKILDLCAAPGGKTLVLSSIMPEEAELFSNERSFYRSKRLERVCDEHMKEDVRSRVKISCSDGAKWCKKENEAYDRILLDAPCSSERHVLQDPKYLNEWSPSRIKMLAMEQWALLSSAYRLLKPNGLLLYSTCALTPSENDDVVKKVFKKFDNAVLEPVMGKDELEKLCKPFCSIDLPDVEKTEMGYHVLPDTQKGAGPLYFSLIGKRKSEKMDI